MKYFVALVLSFFAPNIFSLCIGHILVKTERFHRLGVRMLAMSMFCRPDVISMKCHQHCETARCGNWNCGNYHHVKK